jgi:hypothetical protein
MTVAYSSRSHRRSARSHRSDVPSPAQIRHRAQSIQSSWTPGERSRRAAVGCTAQLFLLESVLHR